MQNISNNFETAGGPDDCIPIYYVSEHLQYYHHHHFEDAAIIGLLAMILFLCSLIIASIFIASISICSTLKNKRKYRNENLCLVL